jgi:hypothetical protein
MKKLFTIMGLVMISTFTFAQTIVSTTPQNKKVVLEEYTGINCQYCPDGHRIAQILKAAHPDSVFLINIHTGNYATPGTGQPDYRTAFGSALVAQTGLVGYPAGTVNRHSFGHGQTSDGLDNGTNIAESRGSWTEDAETILTQPSYVNVGVEAQMDYSTRLLTIHCEVYYTANSTVTSNKLNIVLTQNNVKGPQVSGSAYYPAMMTYNGLYRHQHMLRNMFTGQWGVTINNTNTAANTLKLDTTFTYTVPTSYISVTAYLAELEVVAFITEGNKEIISGDAGIVNPPTVDAGITSITGLPLIQCSNTGIVPTVVLKNIGTDVLTSATISYSIDNGTAITQTWAGSLASGATENVVITNPIVPTNGHHTIRSYTTLPNGTADMNDLNDDNYGGYNYYNIYSLFSATPVNQDFASTTFPPTNWIVDGIFWTKGTVNSFIAGSGSAKMNFYSAPQGATSDLYVSGIDLTSGTGNYLAFDYAYAQYNTGYNDQLQVQVSTNCGTTWTDIFNQSGASLTTNGGAFVGTAFSPTISQWVYTILDLSPFDGQTNVMIRFHATSDYGNNLYIDKVKTGLGYGIGENQNNNNIEVYPNPATDIVNIVNAGNSTIQMFDVFGKLIATENVLNNNFSLNVGEFATGTYILKITNSEGSISKKVTVIK